MKMQSLEECFNKAIREKAKYIGVLVQIEGNKSKELIINKIESFKDKLEYYKNIYSENLEHKHAEGISIVGFSQGDSLAELEEMLFNINVVGLESIKSISTCRLVNELKERTGVHTYRAYVDDKYNIKVENTRTYEDDKITTIRENTGPCVILEVID